MALDTIIQFKNVSIFQNDNLILSNVSLNIEKGQFIYLIGKVGSGKTSLIKTINAELPLKTGEGTVTGFDLKKIKRKQIPYLRRKIGIVFQDFQLLSDRSVNDNLLFVLKATGWKNKQAMKERIDDVLDKVGLKYKEFKMPHQLSGGEQQRVVIARALLNNPEIILADEPTGNLDPETSDEIMKILFDIAASGRAVIMATHNYSLLKKFPSKTLKCEKTKLVETEHTAEIDFESLME
ncbi:MAG TPA: ATP-binding cassette domain-containing protein [Tenuifilaceae bacterium]|nr:ATP-binding cassette domain-containing protein [Tenuifilaceae bacterium]HPE19247.1 ATP-binding cassette domain-containing protein [Tenuifilaceae bacterium]HPJ46671.1 ATP-binding cassette domain-containing protein [Tenuifilaceae bacterium]HPQ34840.1 ATP-binding cassette domain-containing protein [Tenuifilaceae bacterium]HRX69465.1 ATP-binding cassette domain-containing protein [Tenuifilaceae bacterium]